MTDGSASIGQVIEASVRRFEFGVYPDARPPVLGELVATGPDGAQTYGVVVDIATGGIDETRRPQMRGRAEEGHERAVEANPHLRVVLQTACAVLVVAHRRDGVLYAYLPPSPPRIWDAVAPCGLEDRAALMLAPDVLRPLVSGGPDYDDATAALVRSLADGTSNPGDFRLSAGKALALLLASDPSRLTALLRRIRP